MADCIIKAGESVDPDDARLSDTACTIEQGVIIRPPPDLSVADEEVPKPKKAVKKIAAPVLATETPVPEKSAEVVVPENHDPVISEPVTAAHTVVPDQAPVPAEEHKTVNPTTVALAAGAAVAIAGTAAAGSAAGGFSALQAKIASMLGTTKGAVAATSAITVGTIVAVKALESKMSNLEKDLEKTKKDVGEAANSIDRIDDLLNKLQG